MKLRVSAKKNNFTASPLRPFLAKPGFALLLPAHNNFLSFINNYGRGMISIFCISLL